MRATPLPQSGVRARAKSGYALCLEIDGVGNVRVMICEDEDGVESVVVVCEGANDLRVNMDIREAVSAALGTDEKSVKIYQMKE